MLGSTTLLCAAAALIFGLNLPAIQLVNYLVYPIQLLLLMPFIRIGEKLFRAAPVPFSPGQILAMIRANARYAVSTLWRAEAHAIFAWLLIGTPTIFVLYILLSRFLRQVASTYKLRLGMEAKF